jgi:hypothetical protein
MLVHKYKDNNTEWLYYLEFKGFCNTTLVKTKSTLKHFTIYIHIVCTVLVDDGYTQLLILICTCQACWKAGSYFDLLEGRDQTSWLSC